MKIKEIMTRKVIAVKPETTVKEVLNVMVENHIAGIPVIDDQENLMGYIPERNLLLRTRLTNEPLPPHLEHLVFIDRQKKIYGKTAGDIMNTDVISIDENADFMELIDLILATSRSRFPVIRGGKKVVGMVTRSDILRVIRDYDLSSKKEELKLDDQEIEHLAIGYLKKAMSVYNIKIRVKNGVATLTGYVAKLDEIPKIQEIISHVPGVHQVMNQLVVDTSLS